MASSDDENDSMDVPKKSVKSNYRKVLDSDSSDDEMNKSKDPEKNSNEGSEMKVNRAAKQLESDSSDEDVNNKWNKSETKDPDESLKQSKLYDTDSSDNEATVGNKSDEITTKSKLIDSDSSDEEEEPQEKTSKNRRKGIPKKLDINKPKEKTQRKSAKAAMDSIKDELNIKEISEKQKAERDRQIKIPYHKPKQFTLKEFLARRTINKPHVGSTTESKPTILKMKMNSEDLEKFAQKMKEREEEALEFFKSESEDEEEVPAPLDGIIVPEVPQEIEIEAKIEEPQQIEEEKENISEQIPSPTKKPQEPHAALKTLDEMSGKDVLIDLSTGIIEPKKLKGTDMLFSRYLKTISKPKPKSSVCMNILSIENGKLENQRVEVKLDKKIETDHNRPGFSHEQLKEQLRNKVVQKRLEEVKNKKFMKHEPMELEPENKDDAEKVKIMYENTDENNDSESDGDDFDPEEEVSDEIESDGEEVEVKDKKKKNKCEFLDNEAEDEDPQDDEQSDESSSSSDESEAEINEVYAEPKKGRILKAFVDSDDEVEQPAQPPCDIESQEESQKVSQDQSQNFSSEKTDFTFTEPSVSQEIRTSHINELFDSQANDDDLMDLCSGQFAIPKPQTKDFNDLLYSEPSQVNNEDDLMALCSGQFSVPKTQSIPLSQLAGLSEFKDLLTDTDDFVSQVPERIEEPQLPDKNEIRKLLESSDDESNIIEKVKSKKKKKKRKQKKLGFSDDESDLENQLNEDSEVVEEEEEENEDILIDYDSEENEIEVKVNEKQRIKMAGEYFDNEAELSESEWGSADEDEKGLDNYEADLADEVNFDQAKLQEEIGKIHARKLMDDDIKRVKKIQDLLFEDEENDGIGRERKFRWKNQADGFTAVDENAMDGDNPDNADAEDESEVMWRRMRHEREVLINEQSQKIENETMSEEILLLDQNSQTVSCTNSSVLVKRKFQIIRTSSSSIGQANNNGGEKKESPFLIKNGKSSTNNSFLSRDAKTLKRIASFMSNKGDDEVTNLNSHGGNSMSFAPCEKPIADNKKRKSDGNPKSENVKKRKVESQGFLLLDQLK